MNKNVVINLAFILCVVIIFYFIFVFLKQDKEREDEYFLHQHEYLHNDAEDMRANAAILMEKHQSEMAIQQLNTALLLDPDNDLVKQDLAEAYAQMCVVKDEQCHEALWLYSSLVDLYPEDIKLLEGRSDLLFHLGDTAAYNKDIKKLAELKMMLQIIDVE